MKTRHCHCGSKWLRWANHDQHPAVCEYCGQVWDAVQTGVHEELLLEPSFKILTAGQLNLRQPVINFFCVYPDKPISVLDLMVNQ